MKIFVTRKIPEQGINLLKKHHEIEVFPDDRIPSKGEIMKGLKGKEGLLCLLADTIDEEIINSEPNLKMIANYAVGFDNIDIKAATKRKIPVSNTPGVLTDATAELTWALLLSASRRIVEGDKFTRAGKFKGWGPMLMRGQGLSNRALGIIGAGRIGTEVALKAKCFKMSVIYFSEVESNILKEKLNAKKVSLNKLLKESDFVSVHVPLTKLTYHMIGEKELRMMKKTAVFVNTSRGHVVDEKALVKALKEKWIFSAGLDVYEHEPKIEKDMIKLDNVVLQPHTGSATFESRSKMAVMAAENMLAGLKGEIPPNCINPEVFKG
jgi:glyoxylate reductase